MTPTTYFDDGEAQADAISPVAKSELDHAQALLWQLVVGDFNTWQALEAERNDGTWSAAKVVDYDDASDTYTVQLRDGQQRTKYMVERQSLRETTVGARVHGHPCVVVVRRRDAPPQQTIGLVDDFDAESELYSLRMLSSSGGFSLHTDDELAAIRESDTR